MKLLTNHADKFNELVFEHRNKNYGAYMIRKTYSDTMIKAFVITFSAVALLLGSAVVANNLNASPPVVEIPKTDFVIDTLDLDLKDHDQPEQKTEKVKHEQAAAAPNTGLVNPVVTESVVVTHSVDTENPLTGKGDPGATGTSLTSTATTGSTLTAVDSVATSTKGKGVDTVSIAQEMPEYEGGMKALIRFLSSNIRYPEAAKDYGKEGTVYVSFIVDEHGYITGAKIARGLGFGCDEEALRVVNKIPRWKTPGKNAGQPVKVRFSLPISFKMKSE